MKLVNRETFLKLPEGTVFCKFPLNDEGDAHNRHFGISSPCIKGDTIGNDFYAMTLGEDFEPVSSNGTEELFDAFFDMQHNLGKEIPFSLSGGRDGFFDDNNVGFMIFSDDEIKQMINILETCLKKIIEI